MAFSSRVACDLVLREVDTEDAGTRLAKEDAGGG